MRERGPGGEQRDRGHERRHRSRDPAPGKAGRHGKHRGGPEHKGDRARVEPEQRGRGEREQDRSRPGGRAQLALDERHGGDRDRDGGDEVEEPHVERHGVERSGREDRQPPVAPERAEQQPGRRRQRERKERQQDPAGGLGTHDLRQRRGRQVEAEILRPLQIHREPALEREGPVCVVGEHAHCRQVLRGILERQEGARPQRHRRGHGGQRDERRPGEAPQTTAGKEHRRDGASAQLTFARVPHALPLRLTIRPHARTCIRGPPETSDRRPTRRACLAGQGCQPGDRAWAAAQPPPRKSRRPRMNPTLLGAPEQRWCRGATLNPRTRRPGAVEVELILRASRR